MRSQDVRPGQSAVQTRSGPTTAGQGQAGFTLVEVSVAVVLIGVLALVAIPIFMNQRQRAWEAAVKSDLAHAAIQMESYRVDNSSYEAAALTGFTATESVNIRVVSGDATFCLEGTYDDMPGETWAWDSGAGGQQGRGSSC